MTTVVKLKKDFRQLSIERRYAETSHNWEKVDYLDKKREAIIKQIEQAK